MLPMRPLSNLRGRVFCCRTGKRPPPVQLGVGEEIAFAKDMGATRTMWLHAVIIVQVRIERNLERRFAKHRVWLIIISMPSFEGDHWSEAPIGLGQTTPSTGGYDSRRAGLKWQKRSDEPSPRPNRPEENLP